MATEGVQLAGAAKERPAGHRKGLAQLERKGEHVVLTFCIAIFMVFSFSFYSHVLSQFLWYFL
jgi:hypothetical protein